MSKQIIDLAEIQKSEIESEDLLLIRDVSDNQDKKVPISSLLGRPQEGWISALDNWRFVSFGNEIGVVSVNAGGLSVYGVGNRVFFTQDNAEKYGIVVAQTDTTLSILMLNKATLTNSEIENPAYSFNLTPQTTGNINFMVNTVTGTVDGLPIMLAYKKNADAPDVPPRAGYVIFEAILGEQA